MEKVDITSVPPEISQECGTGGPSLMLPIPEITKSRYSSAVLGNFT